FASAETPCADGDLCNGDETCDGSGTCISGTPLRCDDLDLCTRDACLPATGCIHDEAMATGCLEAQTGQLVVSERAPGKERVVAKLARVPLVIQRDYGNPLV